MPPELGTVRRLVERGHRVTVLAEDSMRADVAASGATFRPVDHGAQPARPSARARPLPRLGVQDPDRSCSSGCSTSSSSARPPPTPPTCSRRSPTSAPTWSCARSSPSAPWSAPRRPACPSTCCSRTRTCSRRPACRRSGLGLQPATGVLGRARDRALNGFTGRLWAKGLPGLNELRAAHGLAPLEHVLRPDPPRPADPRAHLGRLRLPGRAARQRPLRRAGARRPGVGGHTVDGTGR